MRNSSKSKGKTFGSRSRRIAAHIKKAPKMQKTQILPESRICKNNRVASPPPPQPILRGCAMLCSFLCSCRSTRWRQTSSERHRKPGSACTLMYRANPLPNREEHRKAQGFEFLKKKSIFDTTGNSCRGNRTKNKAPENRKSVP